MLTNLPALQVFVRNEGAKARCHSFDFMLALLSGLMGIVEVRSLAQRLDVMPVVLLLA
jgi:hypothetical protein